MRRTFFLRFLRPRRRGRKSIVRLQKTQGGGSCGPLATMTEAVMDVVGKKSSAIVGLSSLDSAKVPQFSEFSSPLKRKLCPSEEKSAETNRDSTGNSNSRAKSTSNEVTERDADIQVVCCTCKCHKELERLKIKKMKLQIMVLQSKLGLPIDNDREQ